MATIFEKVNWKGQPGIVVFNAPARFEPGIATVPNVQVVRAWPHARR